MLHVTNKMSEDAGNDCSKWLFAAWNGEDEDLILNTQPIHLGTVSDGSATYRVGFSLYYYTWWYLTRRIVYFVCCSISTYKREEITRYVYNQRWELILFFHWQGMKASPRRNPVSNNDAKYKDSIAEYCAVVGTQNRLH